MSLGQLLQAAAVTNGPFERSVWLPCCLSVTIAIAYKSFLFFLHFLSPCDWQRCATTATTNLNPAMHARCARAAGSIDHDRRNFE